MPQNERIPDVFRKGAQRVATALRGLDKVLVAAHVNPDGDALASLAAAGHILHALDKAYVLYVTPHVPQNLAFLPLPCSLTTSLEHVPFRPQSALFLDCGEAHRLGPELAEHLSAWASVNVDHHLGGDGMGSVANWIEPAAAATAQLLAYVALEVGLPLQGDLALALALGLVSDTGGFRHSNTSAAVLRLTAQLLDGGCDLAALRDTLDNNWTLPRARLWGTLLQRLERCCEDRVAFCAVTQDDFRKSDAQLEDLEGFVEHMRRIRGVRAAVLLRETSTGGSKFSLRSSGSVDIRAAAARLGGGGHRNAAGGTLSLGLREAKMAILEALRQAWDKADAV